MVTRQRLIVSSQRSAGDQRVEQRLVGRSRICCAISAAVLVDLLAVGELLRRHVAGLFEQRQIAIGIVVALDAGIAVPVPDAAEIAGMIDVAEVGDAGLGQVIGGQDAAEAAAENGDVDLLDNRIARFDRLCGSVA